MAILRNAMSKRRLDVLVDGLEAASQLYIQPHIITEARLFAKSLVRDCHGARSFFV